METQNSKEITNFECTTAEDAKPIIPEGRYEAQVVSFKKCPFYGKMKLYVGFKIISFGQYAGTIVFKNYNFSEKLPRGCNLYKDLVLLHGSRIRKNTKLPLKLFQNKVLEIFVRTVIHDYKQTEFQEHQQYSVVDRILGIIAGGNEHV